MQGTVEPAARSKSSGGASMPAFVRGMRAALTLLTRVPGGGFPYTEHDLAWSSAHLPLVGAMIGVACSGVWLATQRAGAVVAAVLVVAASAMLTGALHEDGLADTADALGGGTTREKTLAILKDSRIGSFGAVALIVSISLRIAVLAQLDKQAVPTLVLTEALSRAMPVCLMTTLPYVTADGAKSGAVALAGPRQLAVAVLWVAVVGVGLVQLRAMRALEVGGALGAALAVTVLCAGRFRARVGGITGDCLGLAQQLFELLTLWVLLAWTSS